MNSDKGLILTRSASDRNGSCTLSYFGRSENGPFKILITNHRPLFFVSRDSEIPDLRGMERRSVQLQSFRDQDVDVLYFNSLNNFYDGRRILKEKQIQMFESDVRPADRYLMERFINGAVRIEGSGIVKEGISIWSNPKIKPSNYIPVLKWLSIDIETEPIKQTGGQGLLYSIAAHGTFCKESTKKVFVLDQKVNKEKHDFVPDIDNAIIEYYSSEKKLLLTFLDFIKTYDPDLIIGWHVIGFDLKFLSDKCRTMNIPFSIGRSSKNISINEGKQGLFSADIEGRLVIDGPQTLRSAFFKFDNYKLETVAQEILGRGKDITPETDKLMEIIRRFKDDKPALAKYNLEDCILVTEIYQKTGVIEQLKTRSHITGLPMDG